MAATKLTKRTADSAEPRESEFIVWDRELSGFGLRVRPSGSKSYIVLYRAGGGRTGILRKVTIGRHGSPWTAEAARKEAKRILGVVANNEDPAQERAARRREITVAQLCDLYLAEGCATKKPSTVVTDRGRRATH